MAAGQRKDRQERKSMQVCRTIAAAALLALSALPAALAQQPYPTRPITLTHGFAAGGNGDVVSRIVADALSRHLGQAVVVEPRPAPAATRPRSGLPPHRRTATP